MSDLFKINEQFDEKGDELEKIISYFLISQLEKYSTIRKNKIKKISKKEIRGGDGIDRILFNIEKKIQYPLEIFDIHNYLN